MKTSALRAWLSSQIDVLDAGCGSEDTSRLRHLLGLLDSRRDATVTEICRLLNRLGPCGGDGATVEAVAVVVNLMVVGACTLAKASDANDLKRFGAMLESRRHEGFDAFLQQATIALTPATHTVATAGLSEADLLAYQTRLEQALGDEWRFEAVYRQITQDARLKATEVKKLAKAFVGKSGRNKADALGLIYGRHKDVMTATPKAVATGGRLAG